MGTATQQPKPVVEWHRSGHECFEKCCARRYWLYEYDNGPGLPRGLMRAAVDIPLLTGTVIHTGLHSILRGHDVEVAVATALNEYDNTVEERGIELGDLEGDGDVVYRVQRTLTEALIRGWHRVKWPGVEEQFNLLAAEQETSVEFDNPYGADYPKLRLLARADAVQVRKSDKRRFVRNFKSIKDASERAIGAFSYDTQTISEVLACESAMGHEIDGVIYDILVKGRKSVTWPEGSKLYHNSSPLIWCYRKAGQTGVGEDEYAVRYEWECKEPHKMARKQCEGGQKHRLGQDWRRQLVSEVHESGVEWWLDWLEQNDPEILRSQFITLEPVMRNPFDVERWKRSVLLEEARIAEAANLARQHPHGSPEQLVVLDNYFPRHTHNGNCFFWTLCPAFELCWGTAAADPLNSGYMVRKPHHPEDTGVQEE